MLTTRTRFTRKALGAALSAMIATAAFAVGATAPTEAAAEDRAESPFVGTFKTIDDETGNAKSYVQIMKVGPFYVGKITKLLRAEDQGKTCEKCADDDNRKDQPVLGMLILTGMKEVDGELKGGQILDPGKGKVYRCKMWFDNGNLMVRGYLGPFYRTQTWYRVN